MAPSGGRLDEIIRAVRDCPSGALSYAIDDVEARGQVDWAGTRPPAIEVTKDGPYRITGGITLAGPTGEPEPQGAGASREHYALCRCGQSQQQALLQRHALVRRLPRPGAAAGAPTLYEWAGGLPALTRMSRLLYEKHVPADPLLAAAIRRRCHPASRSGWPPGWRGARRAPRAARRGGLRAVLGLAAGEFGEDQRARWVALAGTAADEAGLPADPAFRAALSSCLEWRRARRWPAGAPRGRCRRRAGSGARPGRPRRRPTRTGAEGRATTRCRARRQPVGFAAHIKPLFRARDRQSMSFAFDLWSYDDVRAHAADIARRLQDGSMPCDGAWSAARIEVFQRWADTGLRP